LNAYGFDSQTSNSLCFGTFTFYPFSRNRIWSKSTVTDHGFRVLDDDP
jgi:hypothetical protein